MSFRKSRVSLFSYVLLTLCLTLSLCAAVVMVACGGGYSDKEYSVKYPTYSKVGYYAEVLGTTARQHPEISNEGLERYPVYGTSLPNITDEEKTALINENAYLNSSATTYDGMDADGNLYLNGQSVGRKLYKHTASFGMYEGDVSDDEPALVKKITLQSRSSGNHITGLYAPAGEVITVEMSEEDLAATGGLIVYIGQALPNGKANDIWDGRNDFCRMPVILNTMTVSKTVGYVGSYLGGPIYVRPVNAGAEFSVTISGGVAYSHFILGYTSEEEFEANSRSTAPYFDLEVWERCVRHSGPAARAAQFGYEELYNAARLWEKIASVSTQVPSGSLTTIGIDFLYDPFVAAGAMVAFVGQSAVNCPLSTMTSALNYENFVTSGSWGVIHEYNHHFQKYGLEAGTPSYPSSEVTNNALSLVSYSLFTKISSGRSLENANEGLTDWNRYTNPSWTLKQTLSSAEAGNANMQLDAYANILYAFGQDAYLQAAKISGVGVDNYFSALCETTHYDMSYYFTEVLHLEVSESALAEAAQKNYPTYVPVATIYQTGAGYYYDGELIFSQTVQPYVIDFDEDFTLDLAENIVLPAGFSYKINKITSPENGSLKKSAENVYTYSPDASQTTSGKIYVTLSVTKDDGAFAVRDVTLVLEFARNEKADITERTTYTYTAETIYKSAVEAYEGGYAGYENAVEEDNLYESGQNGNAQVWFPAENTVTEVKGKIYVSATGKYRIALRGRYFACLYISTDGGETFTLAADIDGENIANLSQAVAQGKYTDLNLVKGQYVIFKAVVLNGNSAAGTYQSLCFTDVGWGMFSGDAVNVVTVTGATRLSYEPKTFVSEDYYPKTYTAEYSKDYGKGTLLDYAYSPWSDTAAYSIDLLFDEDDTNFIHSDKKDISESNPFEIIVDMGEEITADTITVYGVSSRPYYPKTFVLYGGRDLNALHEIISVTEAEVAGSNVFASFESETLRYYKFVCTDTYARDNGAGCAYIAFRYIKLSNSHDQFSGTLLSPDDATFTYGGEWSRENAYSTFGHIYAAENATVSFEFYGTRFAVYSLFGEDYGSFEVLIDGKKAGITELDQGEGIGLSFLSEELSEGAHTVVLRSKTQFNIDSVAITYGEEKSSVVQNVLFALAFAVVLTGIFMLAFVVLVKKFGKTA